LLNPALRCDFDDESAGEFNGFQPTSLRNGTGNSKRALGNLFRGTGNFNRKTGRALLDFERRVDLTLFKAFPRCAYPASGI
jgi:hypothetical protein